ncbi:MULTISPECIES: PEP-CTERM sorting domain-containing protein [unclassified Coleofasciculus]|uniref:PEP-CTERM sorting domain-containing protein n=1 Tax=unclassified Coleofasciculus TaxID=2692782 RepID=UPI00187E5F3F|nr:MULTISPECIES: PEP-CTERM sorting domain-containing protein [unclassified Coleofasciculus]MBE9127262.1 PEP-CTERM sorting domain-containing protein [Coleofasciculus sp. LEGE 07081]MBE9150586.1 PEP-CTERM sorting domain-containing protein [Coleofasciculus sp. LEGE 07092]
MNATVSRLLNSGLLVVSFICMSALDSGAAFAKDKDNTTDTTPKPASAVQANKDKNSKPLQAPTSTVVCGDAFGLVTAGAINYTTCLSPLQGNDVGSGNPLLTLLNDNDIFGDFNWVLGGKSDESNGGEFGLSVQGGDSGFWSVAKKITTPFVLSLKSSTFFSAYFFDGITSTSGGSWNTIGVDLAGNSQFGKDLSHATLFVVDKSGTIDVGTTDVGTTDGSSVSVPEPSTLAGLALLVGGLTVSRRRKFS